MEDRKKLISWLAGFARNGAQWAEDILTLKPCDLWPQVRGKTVWIAGDSVSQVRRSRTLSNTDCLEYCDCRLKGSESYILDVLYLSFPTLSFEQRHALRGHEMQS